MNLLYYFKAKSIYEQIEDNLKIEKNTQKDDLNSGYSETEIIEKFKNNKSEGYFTKNILPYLEAFRVKG
eukprot:CAMPEP_0168328778 /NCGR_PEP_ID=MMETSP0213-20121227/6708_1 /TAXON_ID=151035 /ORGANISM="Euplotes harpa, Strain FSP1.4" /LENGTH=68 /DNA_ID=CAMNT_0008331963 /DNA_START=392 /DNA_END=594 /DNA_ORIENTATION=+